MDDWNTTVAEDRRREKDQVTLRWPTRAFRYRREYLKMACEIEDATGIVILNPRNIQATSLLEADMIWLEDKARYRQGYRFVRDRDKRVKAGLA